MTNVTTFEMPEFDDYTLEDVELGNNAHVARQRFFRNKQLLIEADIYFTRDDEGNALKWPYKIVLKDHSGEMKTTNTTE